MARPKDTESLTAAKILKSARKSFLKKGFAGTSINDIATDAGIHKSLIYHHFGSKENLWRAVKSHLVESFSGTPIESMALSETDLKTLITQIVTFRFRFYEQNPDIVRLMGWQNLEAASEAITGLATGQLNTIAPQLKSLQEKGLVRSDIDPEMASYFVMSTASAPFKDRVSFALPTSRRENKDTYLRMIINFLIKALEP